MWRRPQRLPGTTYPPCLLIIAHKQLQWLTMTWRQRRCPVAMREAQARRGWRACAALVAVAFAMLLPAAAQGECREGLGSSPRSLRYPLARHCNMPKFIQDWAPVGHSLHAPHDTRRERMPPSLPLIPRTLQQPADCRVVIAPANPPESQLLNLADVWVYDRTGAKIPCSALGFTLCDTYTLQADGVNCCGASL